MNIVDLAKQPDTILEEAATLLVAHFDGPLGWGATSELKSAAADAGTLVSELQSKGFPQKVDDTLTEVHQTAKNFNAASTQVRQVVADLTGPDKDGATVVATIRESLSNINAAAVNMADETPRLAA